MGKELSNISVSRWRMYIKNSDFSSRNKTVDPIKILTTITKTLKT